jgi:hypothetical protein
MKPLTADHRNTIPGEYKITILSREGTGAPQAQEVKDAYGVLKEAGIVVRYGRNPESGSNGVDHTTEARLQELKREILGDSEGG